MVKLSIVIITFREDAAILRACFNSVAAAVGVQKEVFIIDNGARQETKELAGKIIPYATYIENKENRGFAYAVNQGMRPATGDYVLLLNPDTEFAVDVLQRMTNHLEQDKEVGIASCILRYPDGSLQDSIRRFPSLKDQLAIMFKVPHLVASPKVLNSYLMRDKDPLQTQDVDSIMGAFMFIRRELINDIGLFDERYFMWFEEVDYCKMAVDAGYKVRHYADVEMRHHKGHTFNKLATLKKQRWVRESLRKYMKKHHGVGSWLVLWLLTPLFIILALAAAVVKGK